MPSFGLCGHCMLMPYTYKMEREAGMKQHMLDRRAILIMVKWDECQRGIFKVNDITSIDNDLGEIYLFSMILQSQ